jgi:hypothetical protein
MPELVQPPRALPGAELAEVERRAGLPAPRSGSPTQPFAQAELRLVWPRLIEENRPQQSGAASGVRPVLLSPPAGRR